MNGDLSEQGANIRNYIQLNKELLLDGVGKLCLVQQGSTISGDGSFISPGERCVVLDPHFMGNTSSGPIKWRRFNSELVFALENKGKLNVKGLGTFTKSNDTVNFTEESRLSANVGLPTLNLTPLEVTRGFETKESKGLSVSAEIEQKSLASSSSSDRRFLLGTAVATAIFLMCLFCFHLVNFDNEMGGTEELTFDIDNSRLNQSPESLMVSEELDSEFIPGIVEDTEVAKCALIVGSFSRMSNATEMQRKVLAAGYELYTEEFHEFYRVGVSVDCSEIKGATFMEIEQSLGIDPWLRISL